MKDFIVQTQNSTSFSIEATATKVRDLLDALGSPMLHQLTELLQGDTILAAPGRHDDDDDEVH